MNGTGRISLRARLLILLIAVTGVFLLILGIVTVVVVSHRLKTQFYADLAAVSLDPQGVVNNGNGYLAAAISRPGRQLVMLTSGGYSAQFQQALQQLSQSGAHILTTTRQPFTMTLPGGVKVGAIARRIFDKQVPGTPFPHGQALLIVARPVNAVIAQVHGLEFAELITGGALLLLLALGGRWLIGRGLSPLSEMAWTAQRITTQGDLAARMPDADDRTEVGRLGAAINTMLDRIQQAFGARLRSEHKVRQFAADASHELRTPLTTIRGYAELYRQGALGPDQLPDAMRRIEQEATRMTTLVAELLELARLDRTSSLDIAETDLAVLVRDAVADARAVEPARPVRAEAPDSLVATVDESRIRQVLANLLGNVRSHTPVSTATAVRLAQIRGGVVLEVADAGPGMSAADAARAFDRFYRAAEQPDGQADGAGSARGVGNGAADGGGGSGLGLAIVAAIAQAHGGRATLESVPGRGTRVRIWLPTAVS